MRILLVDNDTHYKKKLNALLEEFDVERMAYDEIDVSVLDNGAFDLIVLSGTQSTHSVKDGAETVWKKERELVRSASVPVIGICFGAQLMAYEYGARLSNVIGLRKIKGLKRIYNIKKTPFTFFKYHGGSVFVSQRWRITELPDCLDAWCGSAEGIDVFKHKTRPIYGLQFHPERRAEKNDGAEIFYSIVKIETGFESKLLTTLAHERLSSIK